MVSTKRKRDVPESMFKLKFVHRISNELKDALHQYPSMYMTREGFHIPDFKAGFGRTFARKQGKSRSEDTRIYVHITSDYPCKSPVIFFLNKDIDSDGMSESTGAYTRSLPWSPLTESIVEYVNSVRNEILAEQASRFEEDVQFVSERTREERNEEGIRNAVILE